MPNQAQRETLNQPGGCDVGESNQVGKKVPLFTNILYEVRRILVGPIDQM